jgi:hypothetical protein
MSRSAMLTLLHAPLLYSALWPSDAPSDSPNARASRSQVQTRTDIQTPAKTNKPLDACSLLTGEEIATVLGEPLQERKPSVHATRKMKTSHCLLVTRDFAKSASLDVTMPAANDTGARSLSAFWRNQFHSPRKPGEEKRTTAYSELRGDSNRESDREEDEAVSNPRPISGLGEEAYWAGSPISGALYVLQGNLFLRISVGGIPNESTRIAKSKSLATAILTRLPH